jgi:hypothetical protein
VDTRVRSLVALEQPELSPWAGVAPADECSGDDAALATGRAVPPLNLNPQLLSSVCNSFPGTPWQRTLRLAVAAFHVTAAPTAGGGGCTVHHAGGGGCGPRALVGVTDAVLVELASYPAVMALVVDLILSSAATLDARQLYRLSMATGLRSLTTASHARADRLLSYLPAGMKRIRFGGSASSPVLIGPESLSRFAELEAFECTTPIYGPALVRLTECAPSLKTLDVRNDAAN